MSVRGGHDRFRRDHVAPPPTTLSLSPPPLLSSRFEEKSRPRAATPPPSRHLWVGNLSHHVTESLLADQFLRFGDLESVAFQPGRSYAFINFVRDEDAFEAMKALKGVSLAGSPLRIQFAKADKSSEPPRDESYSHRREERYSRTSSPFSKRDSRTHHRGPDAYFPENSKATDNASETPSEVLWIGFPAFLKVDEMTLRKAFSPFGEIEKITLFPGRTYAFIRFRTLMSACRAKDTLQGKLFGNPRVHICFARSERGSSSAGKRSLGMNGCQSPHFRSSGHVGSSDEFRLVRDFRNVAGDPTIKPNLVQEMDYGDPDVMGYGKKESFWSGGRSGYDQRRIHDLQPELDPSQGYGHSPARNGSRFLEFSPQRFSRRDPFPDELWDLPDDPHLRRESKKLKTGGPFSLENDLPDYPFSDSDNSRYGFRKTFSDISLPDETGPNGYKRIPDYPVNSSRHFGDKGNRLMNSHDTYQPELGSFSLNQVESKWLTPDMPQPSLSREWKWQGTIAKGGTPICRARCFPVGRILDFELPEFLDCTARTGLDMLAKHYYQAAGTWVVFFVPESDADIQYYNEFLSFLEEKQRAAVAKLDEQNTLFLVPPSEFSEIVLKVPGKLSISGVILRLEPAAPPPEKKDANYFPSHRDRSYPSTESPSAVLFPPLASHQNVAKPGLGATLLGGHGWSSIPNSSVAGSNLSPQLTQNPALGPVYPIPQTSIMPPGTSYTSHNLISRDYDFASQSRGQDLNSGGLPIAETKPVSSLPSTFTPGDIRPDQIAQLASSLLVQQPAQLGGNVALTSGEDRQLRSTGLSVNPVNIAQRYDPGRTNQALVNPSQISLVQQLQQQPTSTENAQGVETDTQRLQATLQLAAALLQQIQQGKGP